jgi:hypothetical protein
MVLDEIGAAANLAARIAGEMGHTRRMQDAAATHV